MYNHIIDALVKARNPEEQLGEIADELEQKLNERFDRRREIEHTAIVIAHALLTRTDRAPKEEQIKRAFELAKVFHEEAEKQA
jgi:cell division protein ZapA (FtsZ GTPase activity inhibitor)